MSSLAFTPMSTNVTPQNFHNTAATYHTDRKFEDFAFSYPWLGEWLGQSKPQILQALQDKNLASIGFASWLAVPSLGILIKFHHQICQSVNFY